MIRKFEHTEKRLRSLIRAKNVVRKKEDKTDRDRARMDRFDKAIDKAVIGFNSYYYNKFISGDS